MIVFGVYVREAACLLAVYLCVITITVHDFWNAGREADDHGLVVASPKKGTEEEETEEVMVRVRCLYVMCPISPAGLIRSPFPHHNGLQMKPSDAGENGPASRVRRRRLSRSSSLQKRDRSPPGESKDNGDEMSLEPVYALPGGGGQVPTFMEAFDNEFVHFFKNVGILGGLVLLAIQEM